MREQPDYYEYTIQPGDTLVSILHNAYGWSPPSRAYDQIQRLTLQLNPHLHPKRLMPWDTMCLANDPFMVPGAVARPTQFMSAHLSPEERKSFWALSWLEQNSNFLTIPGGIALGGTQNLLSGGNVSLIQQIGDRYADYKAGTLTKGQYDAARRRLISQLQRNIGPVERVLLGGTAPQRIRIARRGAVPKTAHIEQHAGRLRRLGQLAGKGGIVLMGVGLTASCMQIAHTQDVKKKNEILVDTVVSSISSVAFGSAIGLFLISNPIGWGSALLLATGSAAASYSLGKFSSMAYTATLSEVDFVKGTGLDRVCR